MPAETIGDVEHVETADHPSRTDSPEYKKTRKWLMGMTEGGAVQSLPSTLPSTRGLVARGFSTEYVG